MVELCEAAESKYAAIYVVTVASISQSDRVTRHLRVLPAVNACAGVSVHVLPFHNPDVATSFVVKVRRGADPRRCGPRWLPATAGRC